MGVNTIVFLTILGLLVLSQTLKKKEKETIWITTGSYKPKDPKELDGYDEKFKKAKLLLVVYKFKNNETHEILPGFYLTQKEADKAANEIRKRLRKEAASRIT